MELDKLRKDADPDFPETSNLRADWNKIIQLGTMTLTDVGKDLTVAVRLTEAITKVHGAAGVRDGLRLLRRLLVDFWDGLHPLPDGDDLDARRGRMDWLNDVGKGGRFPSTVYRMPLVKAKSGEWFAYADTLTPDRKAAFDEIIPSCSDKDLIRVYADLIDVRAALHELATAADEKFGTDAPNLTADGGDNLGTALEKCIGLVENVARTRGVSFGDQPAVASTGPAGGAPTGGNDPAPTTGGSRDHLYRQIQQIASALRRIEPHSPIPYLLERCVRLGELPFPQLMREVIREGAALDELDRLLGVPPAG